MGMVGVGWGCGRWERCFELRVSTDSDRVDSVDSSTLLAICLRLCVRWVERRVCGTWEVGRG